MTKTVSLRKPGKVESRYRVYWERKSAFPPIFSTLLATGVVCSFWIYGLTDTKRLDSRRHMPYIHFSMIGAIPPEA